MVVYLCICLKGNFFFVGFNYRLFRFLFLLGVFKVKIGINRESGLLF